MVRPHVTAFVRKRAARVLHIHPNTLLYRIRRFEQISGRSLASTESLAEVWLAMRATASSLGTVEPLVADHRFPRP